MHHHQTHLCNLLLMSNQEENLYNIKKLTNNDLAITFSTTFKSCFISRCFIFDPSISSSAKKRKSRGSSLNSLFSRTTEREKFKLFQLIWKSNSFSILIPFSSVSWPQFYIPRTSYTDRYLSNIFLFLSIILSWCFLLTAVT